MVALRASSFLPHLGLNIKLYLSMPLERVQSECFLISVTHVHRIASLCTISNSCYHAFWFKNCISYSQFWFYFTSFFFHSNSHFSFQDKIFAMFILTKYFETYIVFLQGQQIFFQSFPKKIPQTGWHHQPSSQFWKLEVQGQGVSTRGLLVAAS